MEAKYIAEFLTIQSNIIGIPWSDCKFSTKLTQISTQLLKDLMNIYTSRYRIYFNVSSGMILPEFLTTFGNMKLVCVCITTYPIMRLFMWKISSNTWRKSRYCIVLWRLILATSKPMKKTWRLNKWHVVKNLLCIHNYSIWSRINLNTY